MIILHQMMPIVQALFGGLVMLNIRKDPAAVADGIGFRSGWTWFTVLVLFAVLSARLVSAHQAWLGFALALVSTAIMTRVIVAPHAQVMDDGPHAPLSIENVGDNIAETVAMVADHSGFGERIGWLMWVLYASLRYTMPCMLLGILTGSWLVGLSGVAIVLSYWPLAYVPWIKSKVAPAQFGAFMCGALLFLGL